MARNGSIGDLRERCRIICDTLRFRAITAGVVSEQDIEDYRPGGPQNPNTDQWAWIFYYANLTRMSGQLREVAKHANANKPSTDEADATVIDALRGAPVIVRLSTADDDGRPRTLAVHPKGMNALCEMAARDALLRALRLALSAVQARDDGQPTAQGADKAGALMREIGAQTAACVAIATHEGPGVPYKRSEARTWTPPDSARELSPVDVLLVLQGYHEANTHRLAGLQHLAGPMEDEKSSLAPSWTVYLGSASQSLGVRSEDLLEDWSLAGVIAATYAGNALQRAQMADAKERPVH